MKYSDSEVRPVLIFGVVLILYALFSAGFFLSWLGFPAFFLRYYHEGFYLPLVLFVGFHIFYLLTGIGVVSLARWGCYLFKVFLYAHLVIGFPIMTVVSYVTLSYLSKHQIERYFGLTPGSVFRQRKPLTLRARVMLIALAAGLVALFLWMMIAF